MSALHTAPVLRKFKNNRRHERQQVITPTAPVQSLQADG